MSDLVDSQNIWVIKRGSGFSLLHKSSHSLIIVGDFRTQDLKGDLSLKLGIFCEIHFTHPTRAEERENAVVRDRRVIC